MLVVELFSAVGLVEPDGADGASSVMDDAFGDSEATAASIWRVRRSEILPRTMTLPGRRSVIRTAAGNFRRRGETINQITNSVRIRRE